MIGSWQKKGGNSGQPGNSVEDLESFEKTMAEYFNDSILKWVRVR
ncbi:hypothetical protein [Burkholderia arboris]|uniref:Uncharacterized protein n=1 Tax=Burkholderia arboris TaxID=488730 RepID=A0ABZ3DLC6_9BURK|nr:hypothetical protein [Burkholderia arboris]WDZ28081.1 hypothetical protein NLX30_39335 [Burkholderia arboris]